MSALLFAVTSNVQCYLCGVVFGVEQGFLQQRRADHQAFYCPNGHAQCYSGQAEKRRGSVGGVEPRTEPLNWME